MLAGAAVAGFATGWGIHLLAVWLARIGAGVEDNLPGFAIVDLLRGRRPYWLGLLAEAGTGLFFAWATFTENGLLLLAYLFFSLIAVIDLKYQLVLNIVLYPAMVVILLINLLVLHTEPRHILLGGGLAFGIFFLTAWLRPNDLGWGDVKLAALLGFTFGFPQILWVLLVGGSLGALVAVLLLNRHGKKYTIPYAPFLCLGAMAALLYNPIMMP
jgi:prepilin signal peptidase PulO-like enzyme (type II secretory pathway)